MKIEIPLRDSAERKKEKYEEGFLGPNFLEELELFELDPENDFVIVGSGPLAVHNLRENTDLDVLVSKEAWEKLLNRRGDINGVDYSPAKFERGENKSEVIRVGNIEIVENFLGYPYEKIKENAQKIGCYYYASLDDAKKYKNFATNKKYIGRRRKDEKDIELIEAKERAEMEVEKPRLAEEDFRRLLNLVEKQHKARGTSEADIRLNMEHVKQVEEKGMEMAKKLKEEGKEINEDLLRVMLDVHDIAKFGLDGKMDTFFHHDGANVLGAVDAKEGEKALMAMKKGEGIEILKKVEVFNKLADLRQEGSDVLDFLKEKGFSKKEIDFILEGVERHSFATKFIADVLSGQGHEIPNLKDDAIEHKILYDADVMNQSELSGGFLKIVGIRSNIVPFMRDQDRGDDGVYDITKSMESALQSARDAENAMTISMNKEEAAKNVKKVEEFITEFKKENLEEFENMSKQAKEKEDSGDKDKANEIYKKIKDRFVDIVKKYKE